jgi:hypothetical protein
MIPLDSDALDESASGLAVYFFFNLQEHRRLAPIDRCISYNADEAFNESDWQSPQTEHETIQMESRLHDSGTVQSSNYTTRLQFK